MASMLTGGSMADANLALMQHDPLGELLSSTFPDSNRCPQLSADQVKTDEDGVRKLIVSGIPHYWFSCFPSVISF